MTKLEPKFELIWEKWSEDVRINQTDVGPGLNIKWHKIDNYLDVRSYDEYLIITVGHPIFGDKIDIDNSIKFVMEGCSPSGINGQFLFVIFDKQRATLRIINDRFTSYPVYFADLGNTFILSMSYRELALKLNEKGLLQFNPAYCYEYILLQRLVGTKTLDCLSEYMPPATQLEVTGTGVKKHRYWTPDFTKQKRSYPQAGVELAELFRASLRRVTSDNQRFGLMLSAGHDSRTIAMATKKPLQCFTVAYSENLEVRLAREIANQLGHQHHFVQLNKDHLVRTAQAAARLCGGMYTIDNALFFGIEKQITPNIDVLLHGHGIDYMFQGMYIPAKTLKLFGRPTFFKSKKPLTGDLADYFLANIGYRLKYVDPKDYLLPERVNSAYEEVKLSVENAFESAPANCVLPEDKWEFMIINGLSRHYSWPNIGSKSTLAEVRTPSFDNHILDFYLSLPAELRITGGALRYAQLELNRGAALISTANFGFPAAESPFMKTTRLIFRKIMRDFTGDKSLAAPSLSDRTWPDRDIHLCAQSGYQALVRDAVNSPELENYLPQFNWEKIRNHSENWMRQPQGAAGLLISLVSLNLFFKSLK